MAQDSAGAFHVGLTARRVVDAALELTEESHLLGWSVRDLAKRLGVAPSVVYHHVGGRDLLARHVVERVLADLAPPPADLEWREWFRTLLLSIRPLVTRCPGVAKWLLMHGPAFPAIIPVIDAGVAALQRAGFGERTGVAYAALLNNALLTITVGDDRVLHEVDGPRDHATMMSEFQAAGASSPGVAVLTGSLMRPFAEGGPDADRRREAYYRFVVENTIAGLTVQLAPDVAAARPT
ncbi:TetR/AcrR family transcriptional regulator [Promicromonospora sp. NPDC060271]|uniref:TetR/AcrR family transcriptional regulator n=1 Tax=Promicromonospora sp. NPDC060271 TaxID=3347089 RepID=UPI003665B783